MEQQRVSMYLMANQKYFPEEKIMFLRKKLEETEDDKLEVISSVSFKSPAVTLALSILFGGIGVDRFYIGDTGMGVLKLLTLGCCGILSVVDWFTISNKVKERNFNKVMMML